MFVDEKMTASHGRQRSSTEDDNPPSPIGMDMDVFMSQQQQPMLGSPATSRQLKDSSSGFRFHNNPMTPPSNPHTPASPGASRMPTGVSTHKAFFKRVILTRERVYLYISPTYEQVLFQESVHTYISSYMCCDYSTVHVQPALLSDISI